METVVFEPAAPDQAHTPTLAFCHDGGTEHLTVVLGAGTTPA